MLLQAGFAWTRQQRLLLEQSWEGMGHTCMPAASLSAVEYEGTCMVEAERRREGWQAY